MAERFEIRLSTDGKYYFVLIAPNGETIALSEMYNTKGSCFTGINAVKKYAASAPIVDTTT